MTTNRTIGFPRETADGDRRTLLTPHVAAHLRIAGFTVRTEPGIGAGVFLDDEEYRAAGVELATAVDVWACPLVLRYKMPRPADLARLRPGQAVGALFHAEGGSRTSPPSTGATTRSSCPTPRSTCWPPSQRRG
jgi:alanine dehydrogenase